MVYTLTFQQMPNAVHRDHNIRNFKAVGEMDHIDHTYSHDNITLVDMRINEAYDAAYGESNKRFRQKQIDKGIRSDRLVGDYFKEVKKDSRRNLCYEAVVQIGDHDTVGWRVSLTNEEKEYIKRKADTPSFGNDDAVTSEYCSENLEKSIHKVQIAGLVKEIMVEYIRNWGILNPNMYLFGAYIHADEKDGTIHMHLDYLPLAMGYKRGQDIQNGLEKACRQNIEARLSSDEISNRMDEHKAKTHRTLTYADFWKDLQRVEIQKIARLKGLEVTWDRDRINQIKHQSSKEFKERQDMIKKLDEEIVRQKEDINKMEGRKKELQVNLDEFSLIEERAQHYIDQEQKSFLGKTIKIDKNEYDDMVHTMEDSLKMAKQAIDEKNRAVDERNGAIEERDRIVRERESYVEEAVAPFKIKIIQLEKMIDNLRKKLATALENIKSFDWIKYIRNDSQKEFDQMKEKAVEKMHAEERIKAIDDEIEYWEKDGKIEAAKAKVFGSASEYIDVDLYIDILRKEKFDLMKKNGIPVPKELREAAEHSEKNRDVVHDCNEEKRSSKKTSELHMRQ